MGETSIEWTDKVWNPVRGCKLVSPGCTNCYAMRQAHRFAGPGGKYEGLTKLGARGPIWTGEARPVPDMLDAPLRWRKPCRVFVNSMSDPFHEDVSDDFVAAVFGVMAMTPRHTYQVLTKRAARLPRWFEWLQAEYDGPCDQNAVLQTSLGQYHRGDDDEAFYEAFEDMLDADWPLPNVWLGVSVEDRARKIRIEPLRFTPAAVRFLSLEPLLEDLGTLDLSGIGWVIVGGESGPGARPCHLDWIRSIRDQCREAGVSCFVKQLGANAQDWHAGDLAVTHDGKPDRAYRDRKGGDWSEWPEDLRVREFPKEAPCTS